MWKIKYLLVFVLSIGISQAAIAQDVLIQKNNLIYQGAFRVPKERLGSSIYCSLDRGGVGITFNPLKNSLFMFTHPYTKEIVEISIPDVVNSSNINELKIAKVIQSPIDITDGHWSNLAKDGSLLDGTRGNPGGLLLFNGKLIGSAYAYYDGSNTAYRSHYIASPNWTITGTNFHGMYRVGANPLNPNSANGGFVGGYMALIPPKWRTQLGGSVLTGLGGIPIISRSSYGPCAWVFNPDDLGSKDPAPATMLVGYPSGHTTLGSYDGPSPYFNGATEIRGLAFPFGTRSVLFFGRYGYGKNGDGKMCYGVGTSDPSLDRKEVPGTDGHVHYCYDPTSTDKGPKAYPYVYRVWAYDANDLLKVKNEEINPETGQPYKPWDLKPYATWDLDFPFAKDIAKIGGVAYDPTSQRIFISESRADKVGYGYYPLIQVYKVNIPSNDGTVPPPPDPLYQAP